MNGRVSDREIFNCHLGLESQFYARNKSRTTGGQVLLRLAM